ncbi:MAG: cobalamin-dependent protein, partial [Planctomycetes bacterium]|nr:cobalamin-dependent protein [Planctomycetota bacterium]
FRHTRKELPRRGSIHISVPMTADGMTTNLWTRLGITGRGAPTAAVAPTDDLAEIADQLIELAVRLRSHLSLAEDVETSNRAIARLLELIDANRDSARFAEVTQKLASTTTRVHDHVDRTSSALQEATSAIDEFGATVDAFDGELAELGRNFDKIAEASQGIQRIAEQSRMLALNARIEAARAGGEVGEAFSVVAREVAELSKSTQGLNQTIATDVEQIHGTLERTASHFSRNRDNLQTAREAVASVSHHARELGDDSETLIEACDTVRQIAQGHVAVQGALEKVARHCQWIDESGSALTADLPQSAALLVRLVRGCGSELGPRLGAIQDFDTAVLKALRDTDLDGVDAILERVDATGLDPAVLLPRLSELASSLHRQSGTEDLSTEAYLRHGLVIERALDWLDAHQCARPVPDAPRVVLGNAFEDHHDLGRRLVAAALRGAGFVVHDLGLSVSNETFVAKAREVDADVIGVSALLLHTASRIPELKRALSDAGLGHIPVVAGGAPFLVDPQLYHRFEADGTGRNPDDAVRLIRQLAQQKRGARS